MAKKNRTRANLNQIQIWWIGSKLNKFLYAYSGQYGWLGKLNFSIAIIVPLRLISLEGEGLDF